jgi:hypothetical protein
MSADLPQARALGRVTIRARIRAVADYYCYEVVCTALAALTMAVTIAVALSACGFAKDVGGEVGGNVAEVIACPVGLFDCGHVYVCGGLELCIDDDNPDTDDLSAAESLYGSCEPTDRHQGICRWCTGADCGRGCNAFQGCFGVQP